ncbi:MAG: exonuclease domain-containing protein, partial [Geminicoccaceae bacterium]|nr:exonuclease domain-containing protein [Geminicoccaceae bacterium]
MAEVQTSRAVAELASAIDRAAARLAEARQEADAIARQAREAAEREKRRLETVLNDLRQGVIICTHEHRILFFNRRAIEILHASGDIGLGRSLFSLITKAPILHALDRLRTGARTADPVAASSPIVCSTADGATTVQGRISLLASDRGTPGYVAIFDDVTRSLQAQLQRDHLLARAIEDLRRPAAGLRAAAELLADGAPAPEHRQSLQALLEAETAALSDMLGQIAAEHEALVGGRALLEDISSDVLFDCVIERLSDHPRLQVGVTGPAQALHCDSFTVVELLRALAARLADEQGVEELDLRATPGSAAVYVDLGWSGDVLPLNRLDGWLGQPLSDDGGAMTGRDALAHHQTELWADRASDGSARLRLPLAPATAPVRRDVTIAERPEFYDFDLLGLDVTGPLHDAPLLDLSFVVFDTETTGLRPSEGDEIVSIAAKRIVKGRIMQGEIFDRLVHPGRPIPASASRIHGITDAMVASAPRIEEVLPRFRRYVADAVLVAHNAAFDLRFLRLKEARARVAFDMPVLDTVLLSAYLHDYSGQHTLDDLA